MRLLCCALDSTPRQLKHCPFSLLLLKKSKKTVSSEKVCELIKKPSESVAPRDISTLLHYVRLGRESPILAGGRFKTSNYPALYIETWLYIRGQRPHGCLYRSSGAAAQHRKSSRSIPLRVLRELANRGKPMRLCAVWENAIHLDLSWPPCNRPRPARAIYTAHVRIGPLISRAVVR